MKVRKGDQKAKEVGKGGHRGMERKALNQEKGFMEVEKGDHGGSKRRPWS